MASFLKGKRLERYCTEPYPTLKEIGMEHADDAMRPHFDRFVDLLTTIGQLARRFLS
jgi:hypothetical protein